jgi:hypothetical protein
VDYARERQARVLFFPLIWIDVRILHNPTPAGEPLTDIVCVD